MHALTLQGKAGAVDPFTERHYPLAHWANRIGVGKTKLYEWLQPESGPGILREEKKRAMGRRPYVSLWVSESAMRRVYMKHCQPGGLQS
jgi:hypothetical protein